MSIPRALKDGINLASTPSGSMAHPEASFSHEQSEASYDSLLDFSDDTITILVGPNQMKFTIHAKQLQKSPFFKNAMKYPWLINRTITLPADDPSTLHFYFHFLYASRIPETTFEGLAILYVYGEKVVDSHFKYAVIETMIKTIHHIEGDGQCYHSFCKAVEWIYTGTMCGSPARKLLVDIFASYGSSAWIGEYEYDAGFLRDLVLKRLREDGGEKVVFGHMIVAQRYLEKHGELNTSHEPSPSQLHRDRVADKARVYKLSASGRQLHPSLSPDSRTALTAYDDRLMLQEAMRNGMGRRS